MHPDLQPLPPQDPPADGTTVIATAWPDDGPHTSHTTIQAGQALAALTRYLVTATSPGTRASTLPAAPALYDLLATLSQTVDRLPQLLAHTASTAHTYTTDPTLTDDRADRDGAQTATELSETLRAASSLAGELAAVVDDAHRRTAHLNHRQ